MSVLLYGYKRFKRFDGERLSSLHKALDHARRYDGVIVFQDGIFALRTYYDMRSGSPERVTRAEWGVLPFH